jgi:predicted transcriptional regulator
MKDPKVAELVVELKKTIATANKINKKLYDQGVTYRLEDSYDEEKGCKILEVRYLQQKVEY